MADNFAALSDLLPPASGSNCRRARSGRSRTAPQWRRSEQSALRRDAKAAQKG